jgi:hypothetical protein
VHLRPLLWHSQPLWQVTETNKRKVAHEKALAAAFNKLEAAAQQHGAKLEWLPRASAMGSTNVFMTLEVRAAEQGWLAVEVCTHTLPVSTPPPPQNTHNPLPAP